MSKNPSAKRRSLRQKRRKRQALEKHAEFLNLTVSQLHGMTQKISFRDHLVKCGRAQEFQEWCAAKDAARKEKGREKKERKRLAREARNQAMPSPA
jgi:hypothetical protein